MGLTFSKYKGRGQENLSLNNLKIGKNNEETVKSVMRGNPRLGY